MPLHPNIDVAHNGDCGFESIAARLMDLHRTGKLTHVHAANDLDDLLAVYRAYFPMPKKDSQQTFNDLVATIPPRQLVQNMAFALRQFAVDRIVSHPEKYVGAFADKTQGTDPKSMRTPGTWIDGSAITAIAGGIKIAIDVDIHGITIPLYTQASACKEKIQISLNHGHYQPVVTDAKYFSDDHKSTTIRPTPVASDPPLSEIIEKIKQAHLLDQKHEADFKEELKDYSTDDLINMYQKAMQTSDYLPNKIAHVTAEYKGDLFLVNAITDHKIDVRQEPLLRKELIHALAKQAYIDNQFDVKHFLPERPHLRL